MPEYKPRQAIVIIHGIGDQAPMQTLRSFVETMTEGAHPGVKFEGKAESKPDHLSPTLELRRMTVLGENREWKQGDWVSTDFYELYWAHLMTGTAWHHVMAWVAQLLLRRPSSVPARLKAAWCVSWLVVLVAFVVVIGPIGSRSAVEWSLLGALAGTLFAICRSTGTYFGLQYAGDAARYLSPRPENVGVRQAIRSAAVDLLEKLHDDPSWRRYHRIVVVGHSLGSVIAYDALTHLWQRRHHPKQTLPLPPYGDIAHSCEPDGTSGPTAIDRARARQAAMWREQRAMGVQWKVTDFVTLGSPLAHAPFLMASDKADFARRVAEREYPSCPPQENDARDKQYGASLLKATTGGDLLHHAALFACTRWTNLYFDRDIIGGRISDLGDWIDNQRLEPRGLFPHTRYWQRGGSHDQLDRALDLREWWTEERNLHVATTAQHRESERIASLSMTPMKE